MRKKLNIMSACVRPKPAPPFRMSANAYECYLVTILSFSIFSRVDGTVFRAHHSSLRNRVKGIFLAIVLISINVQI